MPKTVRPMQTGKSFRRTEGFAYLAVLLMIALVGVGLSGASTVWKTSLQREREQELLFVGDQYRRAIQQYYESTPGIKRYPLALDDLLQDSRAPGVRRYLRQRYPDPMTGRLKWGEIRAPEGGIMGVYSLGEGTPYKQSGFPVRLQSLEGKTSYRDWQFTYSSVLTGTPP